MKIFAKFIISLIVLIIPWHSYGQCNTKALVKRGYAKFASEKEKIVAIRLTARLNYKDLIDLEHEAGEATTYMKSELDNGRKPVISDYINKVTARKKRMEQLKQIAETVRFDILTYCFYDFIIDTYKTLQNIIKNNTISVARKKMLALSKELRFKEETKIIEIDKENDYLERTYPLK